MTRSSLLTMAFLIGVLPSACLAQAETAVAPQPGGDIRIELNKLQQVENRCDSYFEVRNNTGTDIQELTIKAYLFDPDGIIIVTPVLYSFLDLRAGKSKVHLFSFQDLQCNRIGRWLVNEVVTCTGDFEAEIEGCADLLSTASRSDVTIEY